jgi:hypothetical protein
MSETGYAKVKLAGINNDLCLKNALYTNYYSHDEETSWCIIGDNLTKDTKDKILMIPRMKHGNKTIEDVSVGNGAGTFNLALDKALQYDDNDVVYFLENDYIHKQSWDKILLEGIQDLGADYVSLYDHPDKYMPANKGGNPLVGSDGGEETKVFLTKSCHWKLTNSTTMTFAAKVSTLKKDETILRKWTTIDGYPRDFDMFIELRSIGRSLVTPIPAWSTHGESAWLSPLHDWELELNGTRALRGN